MKSLFLLPLLLFPNHLPPSFSPLFSLRVKLRSGSRREEREGERGELYLVNGTTRSGGGFLLIYLSIVCARLSFLPFSSNLDDRVNCNVREREPPPLLSSLWGHQRKSSRVESSPWRAIEQQPRQADAQLGLRHGGSSEDETRPKKIRDMGARTKNQEEEGEKSNKCQFVLSHKNIATACQPSKEEEEEEDAGGNFICK